MTTTTPFSQLGDSTSGRSSRSYVTEKLTSLNAPTWKMQVTDQLRHDRVYYDVESPETMRRLMRFREKQSTYLNSLPGPDAEGPALADLTSMEQLEYADLRRRNDAALAVLLGNMTSVYRFMNAKAEYAYEVWQWINTNFLNKDPAAVQSYYEQLRNTRYNRNMTPEEIAGIHEQIHQNMFNAGEEPTDGVKRSSFLHAFKDDEVIREEIRHIERDETLDYHKTVFKVQNLIKNLILRGDLPPPGKQTANINVTQNTPTCPLCQREGRRAIDHPESECRYNPSSSKYMLCGFCNRAGHEERVCFTKKRKLRSEENSGKGGGKPKLSTGIQRAQRNDDDNKSSD